MIKKRRIIHFRKHFARFFDQQNEKTKEKIDFVLFLVTVADNIPKKFFKRVTGYDRLFAIRVDIEGATYRIFCCFEKGNTLVLLNGFKKKSQRIPKREAVRAIRIMKEYYDHKKESR